MANELGPAVTALQRKLDEQLQAVADTKRTINMLLKMSGQDPMFPDSDNEYSGSVRADQFYGKGVATSAAEYLAMRKQACQPDDILRALHAGGFDFDMLGWKEDDRLRSLAISLAKNTGVGGKFHRLKNGTFGLRSWYDEEFLKKAASGAETAAKARKRASRKKNPPKAATTKAVERQAASEAKPEPAQRKSSTKERRSQGAEEAPPKEARAAM
jgi:hypothetical protein